MSRRVVFLASGTRGDVQPCVATAMLLQWRGVDVRIATHIEHRELVERHGIAFAALAANPTAWLAANPTLLDGSVSGVAFRNTFRFFSSIPGRTRALLETAERACADASIVVGGLATLWAGDVGDRLRVPVAWIFLQPLTPTRAFASSVWPWGWPRASSYSYVDAAVSGFVTASVNAWRRARALHPVREGLLHRAHRDPDLVVNAFSRALVPPPSDWPQPVHPSGFCFLPSAPELDRGLREWIGASGDVVYIGAGAGSAGRPARALSWLHEMLLRRGLRAVVNLGVADVPAAFRERVRCVRDVSHASLFPQMRCVIHHGGAGTTGEALRSGAPSVIAPTFADQHFWARRARAAGVAPAPVSAHADRREWHARVEHALDDCAVRDRVKSAAAVVRDENGAARAVERIIAALDRRR
jgi:UDP:flavonoid glycosyltransferase YjiC (YdhE family)